MSDNLFNERRFRALTVVDNFSRECLAMIHAGKSLKGEDVVRIMETLRVLDKRLPVRITAASLSQKVWINGRMNTASQWTYRAPES